MSTPSQLKAWAEVAESLTGLARDVYEAIVTSPRGATIDEIIRDIGSYRAVPSTVSRLRQDGHVKDSGLARVGAVGKDQTVWVAGDDRAIVRKHKERKARKLNAELGWTVIEEAA